VVPLAQNLQVRHYLVAIERFVSDLHRYRSSSSEEAQTSYPKSAMKQMHSLHQSTTVLLKDTSSPVKIILYNIQHCPMSMFKDQDTVMTSLELVLDYDLQITVTWSSHIGALCVSVSAAFSDPHHMCGMTFRLN